MKTFLHLNILTDNLIHNKTAIRNLFIEIKVRPYESDTASVRKQLTDDEKQTNEFLK